MAIQVQAKNPIDIINQPIPNENKLQEYLAKDIERQRFYSLQDEDDRPIPVVLTQGIFAGLLGLIPILGMFPAAIFDGERTETNEKLMDEIRTVIFLRKAIIDLQDKIVLCKNQLPLDQKEIIVLQNQLLKAEDSKNQSQNKIAELTNQLEQYTRLENMQRIRVEQFKNQAIQLKDQVARDQKTIVELQTQEASNQKKIQELKGNTFQLENIIELMDNKYQEDLKQQLQSQAQQQEDLAEIQKLQDQLDHQEELIKEITRRNNKLRELPEALASAYKESIQGRNVDQKLPKLKEEHIIKQPAKPIQKLDKRLFGLINIGNSCYMNASLQLLFLIPELRDLINKGKNNKPLLKCLYDVLLDPARIKNQKTALFALREQIFGQKPPGILIGRIDDQKDAHEFLQFILDELGWSPVKTKSHIKTEDGERDIDYHQLHHISIALSENVLTFQDALNKYLGSEEMVADGVKVEPLENKYMKWTKTIQFVEPPPYLIVQLKRFQYDENNHVSNKIIQPIHFPKDGVVTVPVQDKNQEYEIIAYVNHLGMTMNEGHYTTDVKILDKNAWINFNDDKVKQMTPENPEKDAYMVLLRKK